MALLTLALPYAPMRGALDLVPLPPAILLVLLSITLLYCAATELAKHLFYGRERESVAPEGRYSGGVFARPAALRKKLP